MADAYTTQSSAAASKALWNAAFQKPYRDELHFDAIAKPKATTENGVRGLSVTWTYVNDLAIDTTPIDEIIDPDSITFSTSTKTLTLAEYARTVKSTALARTTGFVDLNREIVDLVGVNAGQTIDTLVANVLAAHTNVNTVDNTAVAALTASQTISTVELEKLRTQMEVANVPKINGYYNLYLHPNQIHDLRIEAGAVGFRQLPEQTGVRAHMLIDGTIGEWAGFRIIPANRTPMVADAGAGAVDVYTGIAVGADGLAKGYSDHPEAPGIYPEVRHGLAVDPLGRNKPVSWYWLGGYKILRDEGVRLLKTAASLGTNV